MNSLEGFASFASSWMNDVLTVTIEGHDLEREVLKLKRADAYRKQQSLEGAWYEEGYRRRYKNTMHNYKPLDQDLMTKGRKHEQWRRCTVG